MITSNLKSILEQKKLTVSKVSKETGISRQAITSLMNNEKKGVQFKTIDILTDYLGVTIEDLFHKTLKDYLITFNDKKITSDAPLTFLMDIDVTEIDDNAKPKETFHLTINLNLLINSDIFLGFSAILINAKRSKDNKFANTFFKSLTSSQIDNFLMCLWFEVRNDVDGKILENGNNILFGIHKLGKKEHVMIFSSNDVLNEFKPSKEEKKKRLLQIAIWDDKAKDINFID